MPRDVLLESNDLPAFVGDLVDSDEVTAQRVAVRLRTHRGEWLLDASAGLPYGAWAGRKIPPRVVVAAAKAEIESTPGVLRADLVGDLDTTTRRTTVTGRVTLDSGEAVGVNFAPIGPFGDALATFDPAPIPPRPVR